MSAFSESLFDVFGRFCLPLDADTAFLFEKFYDLVAEKNAVMNLTAVTQPEEAALLHFYDSVSILRFVDIPSGARVMDIGTGAGFPGIPLCVMRRGLVCTLLDATRKKAEFVRQASKSLGLNIKVVCARAEELAHDPLYRERYDFVLSRAVAGLRGLLELCAPFAVTGGRIVAYRGAAHEKELLESLSAQEKLHLRLENRFYPYTERNHALLVFQKTAQTQKTYPRKTAQIKKSPL